MPVSLHHLSKIMTSSYSNLFPLTHNILLNAVGHEPLLKKLMINYTIHFQERVLM